MCVCSAEFWWRVQDVFGLEESGCVGRSLKMIEGPLTQQSTLLSLYEAVSSGISSKWQLTTYHADGRPFINHLRVVPVKVNLALNLAALLRAWAWCVFLRAPA